MNDKPGKGTCEHCGDTFPYSLIHNGFNDSSYAYCDSCGLTALLDGWKIPEGVSIKLHTVIQAKDEVLLLPCECGGKFQSGASPRCPHCQKPLSAELAESWIEENAPGTAKGWRWQCSWTGLYCILIDKKIVKDNWKPGASNQ